MGNKTEFHCGFVALFGRPNVGKSTLINALAGEKVSIVSRVPQTTRYLVRAVVNWEKAQAVFIDVPGFHLFRHKLCRYLNQAACQALEGVDLIVYVVDVNRPPQREEREIIRVLRRQKAPLVMALNKIDAGKKYLSDYIELWPAKDSRKAVKYFIPISARRQDNLDRLQKAIAELLPPSEPCYGPEDKAGLPPPLQMADVIREALLRRLGQELPHELAVYVEEIEEKEKVKYIKAIIYVNHNSQKAIVLGRGGRLIKEVGTESRRALEALAGGRVFLDLRVKTHAHWQDDLFLLRQMGIGL